MAITYDDITRAAWPFQSAAEIRWGLDEETAFRYSLAAAIVKLYTGIDPPNIISGFRSPAKVRELLRRFNAGDPGVIYPPARQSWHMAGRAFDLARPDPLFQYVWSALGGRNGVDFGDPNHHDLPGERLPPPAY